MPAAGINYRDHDHRAHLLHTRAGILDLKRATEILHSLVHNDGDEGHLRWMADKILNDASDLHQHFSENLGVCIDVEMAQAAE
jgi:hypothetical protein